MPMNPAAREPGTIILTKTQVDNSLVRPEFFKVRKWSDPIDGRLDGQGENDAEAARRSKELLNTGSGRAEGN